MRTIKTAVVVLLATAGFLCVPAGAADADAGCYLWRDLWYNTNAAGRIIRVNAANEYVCVGPAVLARAAGAIHMTVACLGAPGHPKARGLFYNVGFRELTRDGPLIKVAARHAASS